MRRFIASCLGLAASAAAGVAAAGPTGLINMPDAAFNPDGTLRFGLVSTRPYSDISANATLLPWLETYLAVRHIDGVLAFSTEQNGFGPSYGNYNDKTSGFKLRLLAEEGAQPYVAIGADDSFGTGLFKRQYVAATKTFGDAQVTLGYGRQLIDGAFGGVRYSPSWLRGFSFVTEYDASDYKNFPFAEQTHVAERTKGLNYALEYRMGWLSLAVSEQRGGTPGIAAYLSLPLEQKEWIPKFEEPAPYTRVIPRPTLAQWEQDHTYKKRMYEALFRQNFKNVRIRLEPGAKLTVTLTNSRISQMSRAVGRATRTVLLLAPLETREIRVTHTAGGLPVATYEFFDLQQLNRYFNGMLTRQALAESVAIHYAQPSSMLEGERAELMAALEEPTQADVLYGDEGNVISFKTQDTGLNVFQLKPTFSTYLNGPQAIQYNFALLGTYTRELVDRLFLNAGATYTLYENISSDLGFNNSTLPHVRSDFGLYAGDPRLRLDHLLLNRVYQPSERTYARLTGGYMEPMYGGVGGQWLYLERGAPWAFDVSVDAVKQRDYDGRLGFRDYQTVTALAAMHYKLPYQSTFTVRAGRFLARDYGARFEVKRRFRLGIELGAWYTITSAVDPGIGNEGNYRDKGVFVAIPFEAMLAKDTRIISGFSIAPWTRDAGQMLSSPVDLYQVLEKPLVIDLHDRDRLTRFGDMEDDYNLPYLGDPLWNRPFESLGGMTLRDWGQGASAFDSKAWDYALLGAGAVLASAVLDRRVADFVDRHSDTRAMKTAVALGEGLPIVALAGAGLAALSEQDKRLANTGIAALQASATGLFVSVGVKYAVGRARPIDGEGPADFEPFQRPDASFPSTHATIAWAAVTPFAKEYDAPWLYVLPALTNAGRIASREHWFSDTVASTLLGIGLGEFFWNQRRKPDDKGPKLGVGPGGVTLRWETN